MAKKGRPADSVNKDYDVAEASLTVCRCGSTERAPYNGNVERQPFQNTHVNQRTGREFNLIEYRVTKCLTCGQVRKDRTEILEERDS